MPFFEKVSRTFRVSKGRIASPGKCPNASISIDSVFDEITYLQQVLNSDILNNWQENGTSLSDRWKEVFDLLSELEINTPNLRKLSAVLM